MFLFLLVNIIAIMFIKKKKKMLLTGIPYLNKEKWVL